MIFFCDLNGSDAIKLRMYSPSNAATKENEGSLFYLFQVLTKTSLKGVSGRFVVKGVVHNE